MRCKACNKQLNDNESVYKDSTTGEFLDICNNCRRKSYGYTLESDEDYKYLETLFTKSNHTDY